MKFKIKYLILVIALLLIITGCNKVNNSNDSITGESVINDIKNEDEPEKVIDSDENNQIVDNKEKEVDIDDYDLDRNEYLFRLDEPINIDGKIISLKEINNDNIVVEVDGEEVSFSINTIRIIKGVNINLRIEKIINKEYVILEVKKSETVGEKYRFVFSPINKIDFDGRIINVEIRGSDRAIVTVDGEKATFVLDNSKELNDLKIEIYDLENEDGIEYDYVYMLVSRAEPINDNN